MRMREATGREAKTLHRLLEYNPRTGDFARCELFPLDADWVIVDEASMLDVALFDRLLRAVAPGTRLTLVGDADRRKALSSVGSRPGPGTDGRFAW